MARGGAPSLWCGGHFGELFLRQLFLRQLFLRQLLVGEQVLLVAEPAVVMLQPGAPDGDEDQTHQDQS